MIGRNAAARVAALAVVCGIAFAGAAEAQQKWKAQGLYGPNTVVHKEFQKFTERVKQVTRGALEIEALPVATIVPQAEALDAIKAGLLDAAAGTMAYQGGKEAAAAFWDLAGGYDNPLHLIMWYRQGGGHEIMNKIAAKWDAVFLGPIILGLESIPSKKPIRSVADFKGVKMRSPDGIPAEIFAKLGASVSVMPGTEVYTALDTGKIEATDWGTLSVNDEAGYNRIAPYAIYPGIHSLNAMDFVIRRSKWNALSAENKAAVTAAVDEWSLATWISQEQADRLAAAKRSPDTLVAWGEKEKAELRAVAAGVWEGWAKKSPLAKEIYESQVKFLKSIGKL
ncbi:MAG: TRAP transporter substrate-binding protein DctP [Alphaproteobacteria bacterium]|nr:TRAP transporter substrate-binding protein DctP [Alphaproteobacteria bacterium]